jgi:hypothetical protein
MNSAELAQLKKTCRDALNKLAKWRSVFTGWQLGTRMKGDAEADAVRDHREMSILLRAEVNALLALLVEKKVITEEQWLHYIHKEAQQLDKDFESRFPGFKTTDVGVDIDVQVAVKTTENWPK